MKQAIQLEETNCIATMEPARKRGALAGSSEPGPTGPDDLVKEIVEYTFIINPVDYFKS